MTRQATTLTGSPPPCLASGKAVLRFGTTTPSEALNRVLNQARTERMPLTAALERLLEIEVEATEARKLATQEAARPTITNRATDITPL